jgi:hypothetical protein
MAHSLPLTAGLPFRPPRRDGLLNHTYSTPSLQLAGAQVPTGRYGFGVRPGSALIVHELPKRLHFLPNQLDDGQCG